MHVLGVHSQPQLTQAGDGQPGGQRRGIDRPDRGAGDNVRAATVFHPACFDQRLDHADMVGAAGATARENQGFFHRRLKGGLGQRNPPGPSR